MEKTLEKNLKKQIEKQGGLCIKFFCLSFTGLPDRIILLPGARVYFVETKFGKGVLSARQVFVHKQLRKLGFEVQVIRDKEELQEFINQIK